MKKRILSVVLMIVLAISFCVPVMAATPRATDYVDVRTSGGTNGYITDRFRCTCVQESIPTNFSWSSTITAPTGITGLNYYQSGVITLSDHTQDKYTSTKSSYGKVYQNAILGGRAYMETSSTLFGRASTEMSVTR